MKEME